MHEASITSNASNESFSFKTLTDPSVPLSVILTVPAYYIT
jgi:hypothetical protein